MTPITVDDSLTRWTLDLPAIVTVLFSAILYLVGVGRARRHGVAWPRWRTAAFLGLGLGSLAWVTCGVFSVYNHLVFWALAVQITMLVTIVPIALALGDPAGLARAVRAGAPRGRRSRFDRPMRVLAYPLLGPVLATTSQMVVLLTGYLHTALTDRWVMDLMYANMLLVGCLAVAPLFGVDELRPAWCTAPLMLLFAALDGIIDAIPGIVANTTATPVGHGYYEALRRDWGPSPLRDTHIGGGLMIVAASLFGIPMLVILFSRWVRADRERARALDAVPDRDIRDHLADTLELRWGRRE